MKSGMASGAVAGIVGGIVSVVFGFIGSSIKLLGVPPSPIESIVASMVVLTVIFGAIFGAIYARFHDQIPGDGASKGLYFGLMIWLIKDIAAGVYIGVVDRIPSITIGLIYIGFFMWIAYGPVLGTLYKK